MKIQILYAMARLGPASELILTYAGEVIDMDDHEAQTLIDQGQAIAVEEPEPVPVKRVPKKVL